MRKVSQVPTFRVNKDDTDRSFKIQRSSFKYIQKQVFVDAKNTRQIKVCLNY